jgi:hypothetical protein
MFFPFQTMFYYWFLGDARPAGKKEYLAHPSQLTYYTETQNQLNIIAVAHPILPSIPLLSTNYDERILIISFE